MSGMEIAGFEWVEAERYYDHLPFKSKSLRTPTGQIWLVFPLNTLPGDVTALVN